MEDEGAVGEIGEVGVDEKLVEVVVEAEEHNMIRELDKPSPCSNRRGTVVLQQIALVRQVLSVARDVWVVVHRPVQTVNAESGNQERKHD